MSKFRSEVKIAHQVLQNKIIAYKDNRRVLRGLRGMRVFLFFRKVPIWGTGFLMPRAQGPGYGREHGNKFFKILLVKFAYNSSLYTESQEL